jgi:hypothetical protein
MDNMQTILKYSFLVIAAAIGFVAAADDCPGVPNQAVRMSETGTLLL